MVKDFLVIVKYDDPYPIEREYRVKGGRFPVAVKRALESFRKDTKGKRLKLFRVSVSQL